MVIGTPPGNGPQLVDGIWLQGVSNGQNLSYESGLTAHSGGGQSSAFPIPPNIYLVEFDTVAANNDSAFLPFADQLGVEICVINNGAHSLSVYSNPGTNPLNTSTADTLNGSSSVALSISANSVSWFVCAKLGIWGGK